MATPFLVGTSVAAAALIARQGVLAYSALRYAPRAFYKGGFLTEMTKREAALILGLRETAAEEIVKTAHRRIMAANHPDAGGSSFIATKVNEAKDVLLGKKRSRTSAF